MVALRSLVVGVLAWMSLSPASAEDRLIEARESIYNSIYISDRDGLRVMSFGRNKRYWTESIYDPNDELALVLAYGRYMTAALAYPPKLDAIAEIGFGGGRTAWYLHKHLPDVPIVSVELDPEVVALAKQYFGVADGPNFEIVEKDGRLFLVRNKTSYDVILVDAYRGPFVPFHLMTRDFYQVAKRNLTPGGVLAQNIHTTTMLFDSAIATLKSVFDHVDLYQPRGTNNVVAIAYDGAKRKRRDLMQSAEALQARIGFRYALPGLIADRRVVKRVPDVDPLTDDFAPVEMLKAIERHNQGIDDLVEVPE